MLTIFNRRELLCTFSMQQQARLRDRLEARDIPYSLRTVNRNAPSPFSDTRARTDTPGQNPERTYEYIIYVHKKDYDQACTLLADLLIP